MNFNNISYRIGIINDFRGTFAFVWYRKFGETQILDAALIGPTPTRGYLLSTDSIGVFLNYRMVGEYRSKADALKEVERLIAAAPREAQKDLLEYKDYLERSL